ncbi:MAG TPA: hypothetical protein VFT91_08410, partial [Dehalococcoidia bacterium]|nr:hypothetical protein [Dehalococcoidia bacterium]
MSFQNTNLQGLGGWLGRLFSLDFTVFDDVRSQPSATTAAVVVVGGASVLAGIGSWLWAVQTDGVDAGDVFIKSLILGSIIQTLVWLLWVYLTYQVLVRGYNARVDFAELARTMGFAFAPVALSLGIAITVFAVPIGIVSLSMTVLLTNVAIQHASDAEVREATLANITGFAVFAIV